jgi:C-terminal peptidase prc
MNLIRLNHVDSVTYTPLVRAAIEGALGAVDPHSRYVRRDMESALIAARSGETGNAGLELDGLRNVVTVLGVGSGSPGEDSGVLAGDRIVAVQDSSVAGLASHEVELLLAGRAGTERRLTVDRGDPLNAQRVQLTLRLARYTWPNIATPLMLAGDAGYVQLSGFGEDAASELKRSLDDLRKRGMRRLVLDLRGNPGGLLSEAVDVAALFLEKDVLVLRTIGRKAGTSGEMRTRSSGSYRDLPLVVIVDGSSASAAEALAGALQDHGRAAIVGHRTFGKALVQMPFPLPAGDVLWLTIARVHTPNSRMIQRSYDGLSAAQYAAAADALRRGGPDAAAAGSGGIEPDIYFAARPQAPSWWADARRRGFDILAVQRAQLPAGDPDLATWHAPLLAALNTVLVEELGGVPVITAEQELGITRHLFRVALTARVGASDAAEHTVRTDPEIARALDRLAQPGTVP